MTASLILVLQCLTGLLLGAVAAGAHLWVLQRRARMAVAGQEGRALMLFPVGLAAAALPLLGAAAVAPHALWCAAPGLFGVRAAVLRRARRVTVP